MTNPIEVPEKVKFQMSYLLFNIELIWNTTGMNKQEEIDKHIMTRILDQDLEKVESYRD